VSLIILVIVMLVTMTLLFTMRSFAARQQFLTEPRQSARRAMEYVSTIAESATDMNWLKGDPNALPTQIRIGGSNDSLPINVAYDNLRGDEFNGVTRGSSSLANTTLPTSAAVGVAKYTLWGDAGTDIVAIFQPVFDLSLPIIDWTGNAFQSAQMNIDFEDGCPDDGSCNQAGVCTGNIGQFLTKIGWDGTKSAVLQYRERDGNYYYIQITNVSQSASDCNASPLYHTRGPTPTCAPKDPNNPCPVIHIVANQGGSDGINPPGGFRPPQHYPVTLSLGQRIYTFRVRTPLDSTCTPTGPPQLEQKIGLFNPTTDGVACGGSPAANTFTPIVEGIEDMQIAWMYAFDPSDPDTGTKLLWGTSDNRIPSNNNPTPNRWTNPDTADLGTNPGLESYGVPPQIGAYSVDNATALCAGFPTDPRNLGAAHAACAYDVRYVRGLRLNFTGRSLGLPLNAKQMTNQKVKLTGTFKPEFNYRPAAENHDATATAPDGYDHYKSVTTVMIRNRMLGM